ncbi:MAG: hypothetical protein NDJ89_18845 [Oligoflexia bacterium]|nr:hypothetical protein [Oligoflexia bacterium]
MKENQKFRIFGLVIAMGICVGLASYSANAATSDCVNEAAQIQVPAIVVRQGTDLFAEISRDSIHTRMRADLFEDNQRRPKAEVALMLRDSGLSVEARLGNINDIDGKYLTTLSLNPWNDDVIRLAVKTGTGETLYERRETISPLSLATGLKIRFCKD